MKDLIRFGIYDGGDFNEYYKKIGEISNYYYKMSRYYKRIYIILLSFIPLYAAIFTSISGCLSGSIVASICTFLISILEGILHFTHCKEKRIIYMNTADYLDSEMRVFCAYKKIEDEEKLEKRFIDSCEEILNKEVKQWQNFMQNESKSLNQENYK